MTNEEAIEVLRTIEVCSFKDKSKKYFFKDVTDALTMAIKALETSLCIKEKCAYCPHCEHCDVDDETLAIKALEQEPCEDVISREWLKTAIHNFYYGLTHTPTEEDIQAYIDAAPSVILKIESENKK